MVCVNRKEVMDDLVESVQVINDLMASETQVTAVMAAADAVIECLRNGGKVMIAGNGGSAADAQHIAAEFISRFNFDRAPLSAIALTTDTSILTAIGNDYGYEHLFARQLAGLARPGDVFIGLSTSGNSPNIVAGLRMAREYSVKTIGLTGMNNGAMNALCDVLVAVPSRRTPFIQQAHITVGHIICAAAESAMFPAQAQARREREAGSAATRVGQ